jgi:glycine/D-amino acid oxidase-like deaminating enzyme
MPAYVVSRLTIHDAPRSRAISLKPLGRWLVLEASTCSAARTSRRWKAAGTTSASSSSSSRRQRPRGPGLDPRNTSGCVNRRWRHHRDDNCCVPRPRRGLGHARRARQARIWPLRPQPRVGQRAASAGAPIDRRAKPPGIPRACGRDRRIHDGQQRRGVYCISPDGRGLPRGEGEQLDGDQVAEAEPLLAVRCAAGVLITARHVDPGGAVAAWAEEARRHGARIRVGCLVRLLLEDAGRVAGAATDEGEILAGCVVLAAGWETPRLASSLGFDVPVRGVRGWIVTTRPAPFHLRRPINEVDFSGGVAATPLLTLADIAGGNVGTPIVAAQMRQDAAGIRRSYRRGQN